MSEWNDVTLDSGPEVKETADVADTAVQKAAPDLGGSYQWDTSDSAAAQAADYVRSFDGFEKAADYVERHFEGDRFEPGDVIPVSTRNQALEGQTADNGVPFERKTVALADGLSIEGVFPNFDSNHHVELGDAAKDMSLHQQFTACKNDFLDHMYDSPNKLEGITIGDMERLEKPQGYAPEGFTWNHNPEVGSFDLVGDQHAVGHTGGNALWGK